MIIVKAWYNPDKGYHLPMSEWDNCKWANTLENAPEWDGHTSADVLKRLAEI